MTVFVSPAILARRIATLIEHARIPVSTETAAQLAIGDVLRADGLEVQSEVPLSPADRIDFLVGTVGVELKVRGDVGRRSILRQLERYAEHERVQAIVLATARGWPKQGFTQIGGKPFFVADLSRGWL